ncbi:ATP-dependent DNA helicase [Streptomyces albidoflavus]|uniref:ATP-dependent helicase n=1 Tax=Streptomyces TaxID=1883 RepID=UPI0001CE8189|nr:ATP-dependent DNA helicase [Streptomyces albidoflavus]AGI88006.1 ATP-dependent DNA helicase [Streptomyces albidoflavus]EFE83863.1 ATP-dependent DNA helicase [Streptomyces albidoflavus]QLP91777.1 ATP-dependent DNA helicase [Streptomyces albidoflavus]WAE10233.1 ATP-dependent DNA helicase [Streptomyces albidoflavus]WAE15874.1 ATP-dependent DNA helicase [Streptomyces albidoflavus]
MHVSSSPPSGSLPQQQARQRASGAYRLVRSAPVAEEPPRLDAAQRAVVDHGAGPLLVLAGPGTGKTTTLVESVAARLAAGTPPERILVLTFSRRAAVDLRDRMAQRLSTATAPRATTFHSFCYALVRAHQDADLFAEPLRLLSGPEQDVAVRELLAGQIELGRQGRARVHWPDELRACLTTRGFADEVRAVLARSRELGLGADALAEFARRGGRPDWSAAASFLAEYLDLLDAQGTLDYAELVHRAVLLAERPETARQLAETYDAVYVDEYQDTDPAQVRLVRALAGNHGPAVPGAGGGRTLVAFGDPDQSIYAFRGADVNGILEFPETFRRADGAPAPVAVLTTGRRSGAHLVEATRLVTRRMPLTRLSADTVRAHRSLSPARDGGRVEAYTYPTTGAELDNIADILRRAHLEEGVPWGEMAVLVRSGGHTIPAVRRALTSAGVPLDIDGNDLPLRHEPAVAPLLTALRAAATAALQDRAEEEAGPVPEPEPDAGTQDTAPAWLDTETALTLLASPLAALDAADQRRLGRALRDEERAAGNPLPPPSDTLLARALAEPERLVTHEGYAHGARLLGELLRRARTLLAKGGSAEEALWELWDGTTWPQRLERSARRGGAAGRNADRDLDAVCALFATAARAEERTGGRGALNFLAEIEAQDIAADTLTRRAARPDAVRLMTAHRSKGLEWRLVVVAGVQEGVWPDLRRRGSLLEADRIGRDGLAEPLPPGALLAEERRLFYVAATRAAERLVVTAVKAPAEDGDQPSRFLSELGVEPKDVSSRPRRPLSVAALVAELRATTVDPRVSATLREAAAHRLAKLAALTDEDGRPLVPTAHPDRWWGMREPTRSQVPLRDRDAPVVLSGSALDQLANTCALQWFLGREVKADAPASAAQGFGNVVHVLADEVASGRTPADLDVLMERLDSVWDALAFDAPWKSVQEKENARQALERFLEWHTLDRAGRTPVASEHDFDITLGAGPYEVRIRGSMDRVEQDPRGRAYVVDFKTGKQAPTAAEVAHHPQLAVYQLAVTEGAVDPLFDGVRPEPGGAELVHLRQPAPKKEGGDALPRVQHQPSPEGEWVGDLLATAAGKVLDERFTPTTGQHCAHCSFRSSCSAREEGRQVVE